MCHPIKAIKNWVNRNFLCRPQPVDHSLPSKVRVHFGPVRSRFVPFHVTEVVMSNAVLFDDQKVSGSPSALSKAGNPVAIPAGSTAVWSSSDPSVLTVSPDASNPLDAVITTTGKLGTADVTVVVTLPNGTALTSPAYPIEVDSSQPASVAVSLGTPTSRL